MKYIILFFIIFNFIILNVIAQDVEFKKNNFADESGFNEALNNLEKGDNYFAKQKKWMYFQALAYYLKANTFNPNNSLLNFKIGICYLNSSDKASSLNFFLKAQSLKPDVDSKIEYAIAQGYHYNFQFDEAIIHYNNATKALNIKSSDTKVKKITSFVMIIDKKINECENGKLLVNKPANIKIENLSSINSKYSDYASLITADEKLLIFTSRREGSTGGDIDPDELEYYEDIYQSTKDASSWTAPVKINGNVNTSSHDASVGLSFDGKLLFIYRGLINGGDLYEYTYENDTWSQPKQLNKINTKFHETSACISDDKKTLYIVSDRHDKTLGMRDIFVSHLQDNGEWGEPENLGNIVNTPYDEEGVSLSQDGKTLYFSSTGHNTIGGFDMFKTSLIDGKWSVPENLGYPLNTPDDEMYCQVFGENDNLHGYFSATRKEGLGSIDIYSFQMLVEQTALKNLKDSTDNPDNYKVPIENGEPSNLFANVKDSTKNDSSNAEKIINKNTAPNSVVENKNNDVKDVITVNDVNKSKVITNDQTIYFKVQVGACHRQIPYAELHQRYPGKKDLLMEQHEGWYKYLIGKYEKYSQAKKEKLSSGTADAWVVAYKNGERVHISEVMNILSYYPFNKLLILMLS